MTSHSELQSIFNSYASPIRLQIVELLVTQQSIVRFSKLVKLLEIKSSTLEYHLKQMCECDLIHKSNEGYSANSLTQITYGLISTVHTTEINKDFFANHLFPFNDVLTLIQLIAAKPTIFPDLFSLITIFKERMTAGPYNVVFGGNFDLDLEYNIMGLMQNPIKFSSLHLLSDVENFETFLQHEQWKSFIQMAPEKRITITILTKPLNYYFGIISSNSIIFLPNLHGEVDFSQGLYYNSWFGQAIFKNLVQSLATQNRTIQITPSDLHHRNKLLDLLYIKKT